MTSSVTFKMCWLCWMSATCWATTTVRRCGPDPVRTTTARSGEASPAREPGTSTCESDTAVRTSPGSRMAVNRSALLEALTTRFRESTTWTIWLPVTGMGSGS